MSRKRDADKLKAQLAAMSTGGRAPGSEQATRALAAPAPATASPVPVPVPAEPEETRQEGAAADKPELQAPADAATDQPAAGGGGEVQTAPTATVVGARESDGADPQEPKRTVSTKKRAGAKDVDPLDETPQEKVSVLLYAEDVEAIDRVEATLKQHGLIGRAAPAAWLLRVAAAHFSESTSRSGLERTMKSIKAKDGRGKWRG